MLTPFISSFRIKFAIIFVATIATCMIYYRDCSSSLSTHNNKARERLWNCPSASGTLSGMDLDEVGGTLLQSSTPHGMSHSERSPSGNNLTSAGNPLGMNMSNALPTLENPTSSNQTETDNAMWKSNTLHTSSDQTCSYSSNTNNNTEGG